MLNKYALDFTGKSVIVVGGYGGIGSAITNAFLSNGAQVTVVGRSQSKMYDSSLSKQRQHDRDPIFIEADVSKLDRCNELFTQVKRLSGKIDIVINSAGFWVKNRIEDLDDHSISKSWDSNLRSVINLTHACSKFCENDGSLLHLGSYAGVIPIKDSILYSSFKAATHHATRSAAAELAKRQIRCNTVIPGVIRTEMTNQHIEQNYDTIIEPIALGRIGEVDEVANAVLFLSSHLASYITGASLEVSGGKYCTQL